MTAFAFYLLKVIVCSSILYGYYLLALRNKLFHQWNRFYLLLSVVLSLALPLLQFTVFSPEDQSNALQWLQTVQSADDYLQELVMVQPKTALPLPWVGWVYGVICAGLLLSLCRALLKIYSLIRSHSVRFFSNVKFISTRAPGTPFSFFDYVFWNEAISLQSTEGQQIFQHELVHVNEKHTLDKLLLQAVLVLFWCNPFFWLIRKELQFVHEFLADKRAVGQHGTAAFAAMILQAAYPQQYRSLTNPFFQTTIKRRIAMLTKVQNPTLAYVGRVAALPLIALTAFAFTVRSGAEAGVPPETIQTLAVDHSAVKETLLHTDTVPKGKAEIRTVDVNKKPGKKIKQLTLTYSDGSTEQLSETEAIRRGILHNSDAPGVKAEKTTLSADGGVNIRLRSGQGESQPLYILDGEEISPDVMKGISPNSIQSIDVLKGESATKIYGEKGKHGVIIINLKKAGTERSTTKENTSGLKEVVITGHKAPKPAPKN